MYKYYVKDMYDIMEYDFDTIAEFIDYLEKTPISEAWRYERLDSETDDYEFCKTYSLDQAKEMCKYGYHKDFDRLVELKLTLEKYIKMATTRKKQYDYYVGYSPNIKAYLEGSPLSMFSRENPKRKHIDIYYNAAILGKVTTNQIYNRGAITLSIVEILENLGFSVGLKVFTMSKKEGQIHYAKFNLKRNGERLNIKKMYFPLCHPSFLRRLVFRLREETPDIKSYWTYSYGRTCNNKTIRQIINLKDNDIVICQPEEMGVEGYDIIEDANAMFDYIERFSKDNLELKHIEKPKVKTKTL